MLFLIFIILRDTDKGLPLKMYQKGGVFPRRFVRFASQAALITWACSQDGLSTNFCTGIPCYRAAGTCTPFAVRSFPHFAERKYTYTRERGAFSR